MDRFPDGVFTLGEALQIELCNDAVARLTGHAPSELVGRRLDALMPSHALARVPNGDSVSLGDYVAELARADAADIGTRDAVRCVAPILHKSGVEIEVAWLFLGVRTARGATSVVVSMQSVEESIRFFDEASVDATDIDRVHPIVFENAPIGIYHFDGRGVITACNDFFVSIIGSTKRQLVGLDTRTLPNVELVRCIEEALLGRQASYRGDYHSSTGQKTTPVSVAFAPIFTRDAKVAGGVGLIQDGTEYRRAERMVARAERMASLGTLVAGMVHEIQNPLAFALESLDVANRLLEQPLDARKLAELKASIDSAREGAMRVSSIARDLKTFARADDERCTAVDIEAAIESALKLVRPQLRRRARLERHYEPVPAVWANDHRLVQLFVNLLMNSVESIEEGDKENNRVVVATKRLADGRICAEIEDTGRGIPPSDTGIVCEPFWTNKPTGMGLGLAICHGIVTGLGGEIFHEPGGGATPETQRGTRTVVLLPETAGERARAARSDAEKPVENSGRTMMNKTIQPRRGRVLVIDDEERLAATIRIALSPSHDVDTAITGRAALAKLEANTYDAVLCDMFLPDVSGPDIFETITRKKPELATRFVFLTGGAFTDKARKFLQEVPNARLEKPFDLSVLESIIAKRVREVDPTRAESGLAPSDDG